MKVNHAQFLNRRDCDACVYGTGTEAGGGWANITKVGGVAATSIGKVNGIAVATIAKFNGISV